MIPAANNLNFSYLGQKDLLVPTDKQTTQKIVDYVVWRAKKDQKEYDKVCQKFWAGDASQTARNLFKFCHENITYKIETPAKQTVKSPGAILTDGHGDCKHYSLFIVGICQALHRAGYPINAFYRFVADVPGVPVHHVFAVVVDTNTGKEWWVDPVLRDYNVRPNYYNVTDRKMSSIGAIYSISGHGTGPNNIYPVPTVGRIKLGAMAKKFISSMQTNFANLGKEINKGANVNLANIKKEVNKQIQAQQTNLRNLPGAIKEVKTATVKVAALPARKAFLALLALNVKGFATALDQARKDPKRAQELKNRWVNKVGGDWGTLMRTIDTGMRKKMIGVEPISLASMITLAATIIAILGPLLRPSPQTQAQLANATAAGGAAMMADTYTALQGANLLNQPGSTNLEMMAAQNALNALSAQNANGLTMAVDPGVNQYGYPELTVKDFNIPPQMATDLGLKGETFGESLFNDVKEFVNENKGVIFISLGTAAVIAIANKKRRR